MRQRLLQGLARLHSRRPWLMVAFAGLITAIMIAASGQLSITMRWADLLPSNDPRTVQFNKIVDEFQTSTSLIVVVQGEEARIKEYADKIAPRLTIAVDEEKNTKLEKSISALEDKISKLKQRNKDISKLQKKRDELRAQLNEPLFQRVDYKTEKDFLRQRGLMLIKADDLKNLKQIYYDPNLTGLLKNINNSLEAEYIGREESISTREKEDGAVQFLHGMASFIDLLTAYAKGQQVRPEDAEKAMDLMLYGEPYFLSYDRTALILQAVPTFDITDIEKVVNSTVIAQKILDETSKEYPDVKAGLSGFIAIGHDEMVYSEKSLGYTSIIAIVAILILLIISFRMLVAPFLALISLIIGSIWAIGAAAITVGQLNMMTQMMSVILFGLGIDFSIHLISGFTECRAGGMEIEESMVSTLLKNGKGILTGALTTAFAFLTLVISHSRGMKEMGLVTGFGLIAILLATFFILPSLLVLRERRLDKRRAFGKSPKLLTRDISFRFLGRLANLFSKNYVFSLALAVLLTLFMIFMARKITFDHNYMNIEPKGLTSIALQDTISKKFDLGMDYAMVVAESPAESRELAKKYRQLSSVAMTEDISLYLPSAEQQQKRKPHILDIKAKMSSTPVRTRFNQRTFESLYNEIERLQMNIIEMQDMAFTGGQDKVDNKCKEIVGDPEDEKSTNKIQALLEILNEKAAADVWAGFQADFSPRFKNAVLQMCNTSPLTIQNIPETILDRYANDRRDKFLVTVFPAGNIWQDAKFLNQFADDLESISYKATGMPPVFRALIQVIGQDGRRAMLATLIIIFMLLWLDFRNPGYALLAMLPLAAGVVWMVGIMYITRQQFTVVNIMGLPMILGIGIDDGVHIIHRWLSEEKSKIYTVFSSTGKAILLTSLTTMLAFGSLIFSIYRGFGQLGAALFVGVAACFLTTVLFLPGLLHIIGKQKKS